MKRLIATSILLALSTASIASGNDSAGEGSDKTDRTNSLLCTYLDIGCQKANSDGTGSKGQGGTGSKGQGGTGSKAQGGTGTKATGEGTGGKPGATP